MARAAQQAGFDVAVATRVTAHGARIEAAGFRLIPMRWRREEIGPWASLAAIVEIYRLYRRERPFMVHHVAHKAAILGGIAALLARVPRIVSFIAGVGYMGTSRSRHAQLVGAAARLLWPVLLLRRHCRVIVQNDDDRAVIEALRPGAADRITVIRGSGVDLDHFKPLPEPPSPPVTVAYVGRMIAIKGVATLVEAQRSLRAEGIELQLLLVGTPDLANPSSFDEATLRAWSKLPGIIWCGHREDVREIWATAHIAALASRGRRRRAYDAARSGSGRPRDRRDGCPRQSRCRAQRRQRDPGAARRCRRACGGAEDARERSGTAAQLTRRPVGRW